jgi:drug/metabolite transporter (DMT)-like permease
MTIELASPVGGPKLGSYTRGCLTVIAGGLILSLGVFFIRGADEADAFQYVFWRSIGFTIALVVIASFRGDESPLRQLARLTVAGWVGAASIAFSAMTFILALKVSTFAETFFLCSLAPLVAAGLAPVFVRERLTLGTAIAIAVALAGVYVMVGGDFTGGNWAGRTLALVSAAGFAGYSLATRASASGHLDGMLIAFGLIAMAGAVTALAVTGGPFLPPIQDAAIGFVHGAFVLSLGLWLYGQGSRHISAVTLAMLAQTEAIAAPIWGMLAFGERPGLGVIVGGVIILTAVIGQAADAARRIGR